MFLQAKLNIDNKHHQYFLIVQSKFHFLQGGNRIVKIISDGDIVLKKVEPVKEKIKQK